MNETLAQFYTRDLHKLIDEVLAFRDEGNLWKTAGSIRNTCGNLVLHLIGGSNYLFGTVLAHTGYVRDREREFTQNGVPKEELIRQLEALIPLITNTITSIDLTAPYPIPFDDAIRTNGYVLVQLLAHLNYHLGQVNYLRRALEGGD